MKTKMLKTSRDHTEAMARLEELMVLDPADGSEQADELELLAFLIETYEKEHFAILPPTPIEAIRFRMEQEGLKQVDLVSLIGSKGKVSEILSGKRPLTLSMIRGLHENLGIPAHILLSEPEGELPAQIEVDDYPVRQMFKFGWFKHLGIGTRDVKDRAEELLHDLLKGRSLESMGAFNRQQLRAKSKVDHHALHAWRCRAVDLGLAKKLPEYHEENLTDDFFLGLTKMSEPLEGPRLAIEAIERRGIAVVIEPRLDKTHLDGVAMSLPNGRPLIGLTLRYDRLDNFWFTLFHELGHIKLHLDKAVGGGFWDAEIDIASSNKVEKQADGFALKSFISNDDWEGLRDLKKAKEIRDAAALRSIHPSIIAGRLRREAQDYRRHRTLIGQGEAREALGFKEGDWPKY